MKLKNLMRGVLMVGLLVGASFPVYAEKPGFVYCEEGELKIDGKPYNFIGTNFWYGPLLAAENGDRARLADELDLLQKMGVNNLRVLAGADGSRSVDYHVEPTLQTAPGVYDDRLLDGLDYFLAELEKRGMKAVIYLNNAWEWSGGYTTYLEWAGEGEAPLPLRDGYETYTRYASKFVGNKKAKEMAANHVRNIVSRTNRYTGKPYKDSPAIMSWQIANEPRAFSNEAKRDLAGWILDTARLIKTIDPNHLVSTGSEGKVGCEGDIELWEEIHAYPEIDYANIHIWPNNWGWTDRKDIEGSIPNAIEKSREYVEEHVGVAEKIRKPIVIEEFGYPRDGMAIALGTPVSARDRYYEFILNLPSENPVIAGVNFWGWGGLAKPAHKSWHPGDDFTCDPAHEDQGLYSVFDSDKTTVDIIRKSIEKLNKKK